MSQSVIAMSREINADNPLLQSGSAKQASPSLSKKLPPPPSAPPKPDHKAQERVEKKLEKNQEEKERTELYRKILDYKKNPRLSKFIPEDTPTPKLSDSVESLRALHASITSGFKGSAKRLLVNNMFDQILNAAEMGCVQFLLQQEKIGMAQALISNKEQLFQPELEEVIIELSDDWVPSAQTRLAFKMAQAMLAYSNGNSSKHPRRENGPSQGTLGASSDPGLEEKGIPKATPKGRGQSKA
jgi:hypothetical protein